MSAPPAPAAEWPRLARYGAIAALAALVVAAALFIWPVASVIVTGAVIALLTGRASRWLTARFGLRPVLSVLVVYVGLILVLILLAFTVYPWVVRGLEVLLAALRAEGEPPAPTTAAGTALAARLELFFTAEQIQRMAMAATAWVIRLLAFLLGNVVRFVYVMALGMFLGFLIQMDLGGQPLRLLDRLPPAHARELRLLRSELIPLWTRFVGASLIFAGLVAVGSLIEFLILGVPFPFLMALLTGLITPIPSIGGILSSIVVAVPCLILGSTRFPDMDPLTFAAMVWIINSIITQVAYNFILMPILGRAVRLPVAVVLVGVLASFAVNNILFAFLVVPVLASLRIIAEYLYAKIERREPFPNQV